jgi:hypothetical protein
MPQQPTPGDPITGSQGHEGIQVSNSAVGLTVPPGANAALISVEPVDAGAPSDEKRALRWFYDGTDPTDNLGMPLALYDYVYLRSREQLINFKMFAASDADVIVQVVYNHE